jgi:hypothetical protein
MIIPCECWTPNLLPADVEPKLRDISHDVCQRCHSAPATEICTLGKWREFVTAGDCVHLCENCHKEGHKQVAIMAEKLGPHFKQVISEIT